MARVPVSRLALDVARAERAGDFEKALEIQRRLVAARPANAKAHNKLGDILVRLRDEKGAVEAFGRSAELHEKDGFLLKAIAVLRKAARCAPGDVELRVRVADIHAQLGHASEAAREYEAVAEQYAKSGDLVHAMLLLTKLVEVLDDPVARARLAALHARLGRVADAVTHAVLAADAARGDAQRDAASAAVDVCLRLELDADSAVALASACGRLGRFGEAARLLEGVSRRAPDDRTLRRRLAESYLAGGRGEDARALFEALVETDATDDDARLGLARTLVATGQARRAWEMIGELADEALVRGRGARLVPVVGPLVASARDAAGLTLLARIQSGCGDGAGAERTYLRLAELHARQGEEALEKAARALAHSARNLDARSAGPASASPAGAPRQAAAAAGAAVGAAADAIRSASALLFVTGAELSTDFGLPDLGDPEGFWRAFPAYRKPGLRFEDVANAGLFLERPALAWGFFGARLLASRAATPHEGVRVLARWRGRAPGGGFAVTSNVEGHLVRSGFASEKVVECRGSLHWLQCARECGAPIFSAEGVPLEIDPETLLARDSWPTCSECGAPARPNVLLLGDWSWDMTRVTEQDERLQRWLARARKRSLDLVVVEVGETPRLPSLRPYVRRVIAGLEARIVRISDEDCSVPEGGVGVPLDPKAGLRAIEQAL